MITLALCMAGSGRRFLDAGYSQPKYLLPLEGRPILEHVMSHLRPERALLVANERDRPLAEAIGACAPSATLAFVADTSGQAETGLHAADLAERLGWGDEPFAIHNADTILYDRDLSQMAHTLSELDGYIDTFTSDDPAYSYVRVGADGMVQEIAEKVVISSLATSGLYGFRSARRYAMDARATRQRSGEFYVSDVYAHMLSVGRRIGASPEPLPVTVVGTPRQYEAVLAGRTLVR